MSEFKESNKQLLLEIKQYDPSLRLPDQSWNGIANTQAYNVANNGGLSRASAARKPDPKAKFNNIWYIINPAVVCGQCVTAHMMLRCSIYQSDLRNV